MTRKDFARIFNVGDTLEVTSHWRMLSLVGQRRTVTKVGKTEITFCVYTPTEFYGPQRVEGFLDYRNVTRLERWDDGRILVGWDGDQEVTYRIVND